MDKVKANGSSPPKPKTSFPAKNKRPTYTSNSEKKKQMAT